MNEQVEVINAEEFGIEPIQAKKIEEAFTPKISEREGLAKVYAELITKEIDLDVCEEAFALRKKLVKIRTGIASIHKSQKAFSLAYGKLVDAWKNKETEPVTQMESKLLEIEKYYEKQEFDRLEKLQSDRMKQLTPFVSEEYNVDLTHYSDEEFQDLLFIKEKQYNDKIAAEAKEKAEKEEQERKEKLYLTRRESILKLGDFGSKVIDTLKVESTEEEYTALIDSANKAKSEKERIDKLYFDRVEEMAPYKDFFANIADYNLCEFGTMPDGEYSELKSKVLSVKKAYDTKQEEIRKENERIKEEQAKKEDEVKKAIEMRSKDALTYLTELGFVENGDSMNYQVNETDSITVFKGSYTRLNTDNELQMYKDRVFEEILKSRQIAKQRDVKKEKDRIEKLRQDREDQVKFLWQFVPKDHLPLIEYDDLEWEQFMVTVNSAKKKDDDEKTRVKIAEETKRKKLESELKAKKEKEAAEQKEQAKKEKEAAEQERKSKLAPEKDKIQAWIDLIELPEIDTTGFSQGGNAVVNVIKKKYEGFRNWAEQQKESIN